MSEADIAEPIKGALSVSMAVWFEMPASWSGGKRAACQANESVHTIKPDIDNIVKAVFDGCNGIVWVDDCQVCQLTASKGYRERAGVELIVEWL